VDDATEAVHVRGLTQHIAIDMLDAIRTGFLSRNRIPPSVPTTVIPFFAEKQRSLI
jgi:hypothetical protein